jgi:long-chain acyl-CoA synthetase
VKADVRARLGLDQARWLQSAGAPIPPAVLEYFGALGLPICEFWGMSELSCCATINPLDDIRIGTVGKAIPGVELKLLYDGELLARGPLVMKGYRRDPEKTAQAVDAEGWMHTGDVATIDEDGYVTIVDRKKELIINAAGKNMSPANIEQKLKASSPLIGQAICIGDRRPYNVALLVLDPDVGAQWAQQHGLANAALAVLGKHPDCCLVLLLDTKVTSRDRISVGEILVQPCIGEVDVGLLLRVLLLVLS